MDQDSNHGADLTPIAGGGDYVSPGFRCLFPDRHFPNITVLDTSKLTWPYLRRNSPHTLYGDRRIAHVGFLSRDEATLLHNIGLQFSGRRALEIGCFMGWSAYHLAAAGVHLDVIDPLLANPKVRESVVSSLKGGGLKNIRLMAGKSPAGVHELAARDGRGWSLIFIDGDHEGDAPRTDAETCHAHAEPDAMIVFHDLLSPHVAGGLRWLSEHGWQTKIYDTSQIMGCAYRGGVRPIAHTPDPVFRWDRPEHLSGL